MTYNVYDVFDRASVAEWLNFIDHKPNTPDTSLYPITHLKCHGVKVSRHLPKARVSLINSVYLTWFTSPSDNKTPTKHHSQYNYLV